MHTHFIPSLRTDLQSALLDPEGRGAQHQVPALIFPGAVALLLELLGGAVAAEHLEEGFVDAVMGVVGEVGDLEVEGGEMEMLAFGEGAVAGVSGGDLFGPGAVVPVVDDAVVAWELVDDDIVFVGFDWEAVGLVGEVDSVVGELVRGRIRSIGAVIGLFCNLNLLHVFGVGHVIGHSAVAEVGCLAADEKWTQF